MVFDRHTHDVQEQPRLNRCRSLGQRIWHKLRRSIRRSNVSASSRNLQQEIGGHEELDLLIKASGASGGVNPPRPQICTRKKVATEDRFGRSLSTSLLNESIWSRP